MLTQLQTNVIFESITRIALTVEFKLLLLYRINEDVDFQVHSCQNC